MGPLWPPSRFWQYWAIAGMLVLTGAWELFYEQNCRLVARARRAGVEVRHQIEPGMLHAYPAFAALLPQGRAALRVAARYVRALASDARA